MKYEFSAAADNFEPHPRNYLSGKLETEQGTEREACILSFYRPPKDAARALYVLDFGDRVEVRYTGGWRKDGTVLFLYSFPLSVGTRPDGRPIDMSGWLLGPRRAYHLKLTEVKSER